MSISPETQEQPGVLRGAAVIEAALRTLPDLPGVYRMIDPQGAALYVGKAKSLKKRVIAYVRPERLPARLRRMVIETASLEVVTTRTEVEALLLESNLIKKLRPRFNILLRDDKSFPFILIADDHDFPRVQKHRGARKRSGRYYGPFASAGAVNRTLNTLQKAFLLRSCTDSVFSSRSRPCLLFQIKRCSAPCVGRIERDAYAGLVAQAAGFLEGGSTQVQKDLAARMEDASARMEFEEAALYRDRIRALSAIRSHQDINAEGVADADIVGLHMAGGQACIQVFFFRGGQNFGNRAYYPTQIGEADPGTVLEAFLGQFYEDKLPPREVLVSETLPNAELTAEALSIRAGVKVRLHTPQRGSRRKLVEHALLNAREALGRKLAEADAHVRLMDAVAKTFGLASPPRRIEVYDNSHTMGGEAIGGMIVAGPEGLMKNAYRRFNIRGDELSQGDDYGMLRQVLTRRFTRAQKEDPDRALGTWPDLLLIDGGAGQLAAAQAALADTGVADIPLVAIAKGPDRNAGRERFFMPGRAPFQLPPGDATLYFLQRLRDEAHRFAITGHRARRGKALSRSLLDEVPGIGPERKKALLHHFGSARRVAGAAVEDLAAVDGVSAGLAQRIYDHFHPQG